VPELWYCNGYSSNRNRNRNSNSNSNSNREMYACRACLSSIVKARGGLDVLYAELGDAGKSGPALAFMATLIKDYGAVEESVALYYKALELCPEMTTYVLNLVHTLEVCAAASSKLLAASC
jgi:hypothetical protein